MTLVSCASQQGADRAQVTVGMAQYEDERGVRYQLCTRCPTSTPKTLHGTKKEMKEAEIKELKPKVSEAVVERPAEMSTSQAHENKAFELNAIPESVLVVVPEDASKGLIAIDKMLNVYFRFDSSVLTQKGKETLNDYFGSLQKEKRIESIESINVVGHTDGRGPDYYNRSLERSRALVVKRYLKQNFFPRKELITTSSSDVCCLEQSGKATEARAKARRASVFINFKSKK